jgi:hypothetical protein
LRHTNYQEYDEYIAPWLASRTSDDLADFKVFAVFREPTEWLFSWYRFRQRREVSPDVVAEHPEYTGHIGWDEFLRAYLNRPRPEFARVGVQSSFVLDREGQIGPDGIFAYDKLNSLVDELSRRIGEHIELDRFNESPRTEGRVEDRHYALCRECLVDDYRIYDSL